MQESRQVALKQTEEQVKQMRNEASAHTHSKTHYVRNKLTTKVAGKTPKAKVYPSGLSDQDIKAALSLVDESWAIQEHRLQQYLQRNYGIANGIPMMIEVGEEEYERPDTATSLGKIVEKVTIESTPTIEKNAQLGGPSSPVDYDISDLARELELTFSGNHESFL